MGVTYAVCASGLQVVVTGNFILARRNEEDHRDTFSIWYGQDYSLDGARNLQAGRVHQVASLSDVGGLPTNFSLETFERRLTQILDGKSGVRVYDLASIVFIIRKVLPRYDRDRTTEGRSHVTLY